MKLSKLGSILALTYLGGLFYSLFYEQYLCNPHYYFNCHNPLPYFFYPAMFFVAIISGNFSPPLIFFISVAVVYTLILYSIGAFVERFLKTH